MENVNAGVVRPPVPNFVTNFITRILGECFKAILWTTFLWLLYIFGGTILLSLIVTLFGFMVCGIVTLAIWVFRKSGVGETLQSVVFNEIKQIWADVVEWWDNSHVVPYREIPKCRPTWIYIPRYVPHYIYKNVTVQSSFNVTGWGTTLWTYYENISINIFMVLFITLCLVNVTWILLSIRGKRNGKIYEAKIQGSEFSANGIFPKCQIEFYKPGLITDTFIGYGIRVLDEVIAVPAHVYTLAGKKLLLSKPGLDCKVKIDNYSCYPSNLVTDLVYLKVPKSILINDLNVSIARFAKGMPAGAVVTINGKRGASEGSLSRFSSPGMLEYSGSTLPGYSGAPYYVGDTIYGIHSGVSGSSGVNIGISSAVLAVELRKKFVPEGSLTFSSPSHDGSYEEDLLKRKKRFVGATWTADEIEKMYEQAFDSGTDWAKGQDIDYDEQIQWEHGSIETADLVDAVETMSPTNLVLLSSLCNSKLGKVKIQGQSEEPQEVVIENPLLSSQNAMQRVLAIEIDNLKEELCKSNERIKKLEEKLEKQERLKEERSKEEKLFKEKKNEGKYSCDVCEKAFLTEIALDMHKMDKHQVGSVQDLMEKQREFSRKARGDVLESANVLDEFDTTKPGPSRAFLANPSQRPRPKIYKRPLNTAAKPNQFSLIIENQKNTDASLKRLLDQLEKLVPVLAGQSSVQQQN